jgi:Large eukaryotic DNA virus major capsid protein.
LVKWDKLPENQNPLQKKLLIPLKFWFCKELSHALPLIALQYHDIKLDITFRNLKSLIIGSNYQGHVSNFYFMENDALPIPENDDLCISIDDFTFNDNYNIKLWTNVIYLDNDERKRFAKSSHEYLIEQVQKIKNDYSINVDIPFNHNVKSLYWVIQNKIVVSESKDYKNINYFLNGSGDGFTKDNNNIPFEKKNNTRILRKTDNISWKDEQDYFNYDTESLLYPLYNKERYRHMIILKNVLLNLII